VHRLVWLHPWLLLVRLCRCVTVDDWPRMVFHEQLDWQNIVSTRSRLSRMLALFGFM
jgi:hypothetical protein